MWMYQYYQEIEYTFKELGGKGWRVDGTIKNNTAESELKFAYN